MRISTIATTWASVRAASALCATRPAPALRWGMLSFVLPGRARACRGAWAVPDAPDVAAGLRLGIEALVVHAGSLLRAERATLFLVSPRDGELRSLVAQGDGGARLDIRLPLASGIAGRVARTGEVLNVANVRTAADFHRVVDERTGYRTRNVLCVPIWDGRPSVAAVGQLLNKRGAASFSPGDARRFRELAVPIGVLLRGREAWGTAAYG